MMRASATSRVAQTFLILDYQLSAESRITNAGVKRSVFEKVLPQLFVLATLSVWSVQGLCRKSRVITVE